MSQSSAASPIQFGDSVANSGGGGNTWVTVALIAGLVLIVWIWTGRKK